MKRQIDKKLLFQILLAIAVCVLITIASGCRTGGVKLNPNSAGKIIQPKSPEQINKEVKAKREEAKKFENAKPQTIEPAKIKPVRTQPHSEPYKPTPIEVEIKPTKVKPAGSATQIEPTVSSTADTSLPLTVETTEESETILLPILPESKGDRDSGVIVNNQESVNKINWLHLFSLFMILFTGALILWVAYDIIKDIFNMRKQGTPMRDHLESLKKPAKGTRAARKKAVAKKPAVKKTKKRTPKKKG
jgi:hypothetical protein